jgi:putative nucleotidyltransferase with HDIG domain
MDSSLPAPEYAAETAHPAPARIGAIILAAGYSSRMGQFKPLLPFGGATVLQSTVQIFLRAGIEDVLVVLGHRANELRPVAEAAGARCVVNADFAEGMFTSVRAAARAFNDRLDGCFLLPVDMPLVRSTTIHRLAEAFAVRPKDTIHPVFAGHRGHPPLIPRSILLEAVSDIVSGPLSAVLARHTAVEVCVADEAIHIDMDSPADYANQLVMAARRDIPTIAECKAILATRGVASNVTRHCRKVADVATVIAEALVDRGVELDRDLIVAGALLHDIAKGQPGHAQAGADLLRSMEFPRVAEIVASHMELSQVREVIGELEIVFLADKLVRGEAYVGLDERFRAALARFQDDPEALAAARRRLAVAQALAVRIEARLDRPIEEVFYVSGRGRESRPSLASNLLHED